MYPALGLEDSLDDFINSGEPAMFIWIVFSGASQTGKSSACNKIAEQLLSESAKTTFIEHPVSSIGHGVAESFGWPPEKYDRFKTAKSHGRTGREWIISVVEHGLRAHDPDILSKLMADRIAQQVKSGGLDINNCVGLVESIGFEREIQYLRSNSIIPNARLLHVNMNREGFEYESIDSRQNLAHLADLRTTLPSVKDVVMEELRSRMWL